MTKKCKIGYHKKKGGTFLLKFCICVQKREDYKKLKEYITKHMKKYHVDFDITPLYSVSKLFENEETFDIIFVDMALKDDNKFETIISLERNRKKSIQIFFSSHADEQQNNYNNYVFCFLVKTIMKANLVEALNNALATQKEEKKILVRNGLSQICLKLDEVVYIEANNKEIGIRTFNDFITTKETLSNLEEKIHSINFYKPHRSYLVNMDYIKSFNRQFILMHNGEKIVLSRLKREEFINVFFSYVKNTNK